MLRTCLALLVGLVQFLFPWGPCRRLECSDSQKGGPRPPRPPLWNIMSTSEYPRSNQPCRLIGGVCLKSEACLSRMRRIPRRRAPPMYRQGYSKLICSHDKLSFPWKDETLRLMTMYNRAPLNDAMGGGIICTAGFLCELCFSVSCVFGPIFYPAEIHSRPYLGGIPFKRWNPSPEIQCMAA